MEWKLQFSDIAIICATLLGPVLAIQVQKYLERLHNQQQRRVWIFKTLMNTRAAPVSQAHVEALNAVAIEFYGRERKLKQIVKVWKTYIDHLTPSSAMPIDRWAERKEELFLDLLAQMAEYLGYDFNKVEIKKEIYAPSAHARIESDQETIRQGLVKLFGGEFAVPIDVKAFPIDPKALSEQEELRQLFLKWLNKEQSVKIEVEKNMLKELLE
jgi:hypothetical protein